LQQKRIVKTERGGEFPDVSIAREAIEERIEIVKRVSDLVDRVFLRIFK
jgi:hypothetical protein